MQCLLVIMAKTREKKVLDAKWMAKILEPGFTAVPSVLLWEMSALGLKEIEDDTSHRMEHTYTLSLIHYTQRSIRVRCISNTARRSYQTQTCAAIMLAD